MSNIIKRGVSIAVTTTTILWSIGAGFAPLATRAASAGDLIKMDGNSAVYYLGASNKRYVFPNSKAYTTWYPDFSGVVTVSQSELQSYAIGGNVTYRSGTRLVKITTDPKVYAVEPGGTLRWVENESVATTLYGANWAQLVDDVSDAFFVNYTVGSSISSNTYPTGSLIKQASSSDVYYVDGSSKRLVSTSGFSGNKFQQKFVLTSDSSVFNALTLGSQITAADSNIWNLTGGASTTTVGGTGLTVALAADTPAGGVVADLTAFNPALKVNLTASSDGSVALKGLTVTRLGLSQDSDISGVGIYDANGVRHGNFVTFANTKANVNFSSDPINVPAGQTVAVWVKVNLANVDAQAGTYAMSIVASGDVNTSASVTGSFPISGNGYSIINGASSVGSLSVDAVQVFSNGNNDATAVNINLGTVGQEVSRFRFVAGSNEDIKINRVTLYNSGNANDGDVQNIKLVGPDGTVLSTLSQTTNRVASFDLSASPYLITKGNTRDLSVRVDVVSGSTGTVRFVVQNDYDVEVVGVATASGLLPTAAALVDTSFPIGDVSGQNASCTTSIPCINKITINSGTLLYAKASDAPTGNVAAGGSNVVLGKWEATPQGEDMELRTIQYTVNAVANLTGTLQVKVNGSAVYSVTATGADTTLTTRTLSSYPVVKANQKAIITIETGISSTATSGASLTATLDVTQVKRLSTNDIVDPTVSATAANTLTISTASLAVAKNASYPSTTIVAGLSNAKVGSFNFTASSTEDVSVASITVGLTNVTNVSNVMLQDGTTQIGSTVTSPSASNVFSLTGITIPRGSTKTYDVYVTTNGSTTGSEVASITAVSATGKSSSATVTATGLTATGQTISFTTAGTLTVTNDSTNTPVAQVLHSGQVDAPLLAVRLTTNNAENVKVTAVQVSAVNGAASLQDLKLYVGNTQVGATTQLANGVALFSDFTNGLFSVAKDTTSTLTVRGTTTSSGSLNSQATSDISLDYVEALGASGGSRIKPGATLSTTWSQTDITTAGASITVASTAGFHRGDVVFAYDGTNGGTLGMVTVEPSSTTAMTVSGRAALAYAGSATISKIETGATTPATAGTPTKAGVSLTVTSSKAFTVGDPVLVQGATAPQLGFVSLIADGTHVTVNTITTGSIGVASQVSKIGSDNVSTGITATTALTTTTAAIATTVTSTTGFQVGDFVLIQDTTANGTYGVVTAIGSTTAITLAVAANVTPTSTSSATLVRVGSVNPSTTFVTTAATAAARVIAATATTVTDTTGFGAGDVVISAGTTVAPTAVNAIFGVVGSVTTSTSMTVGAAIADAAASAARISRLPGASASGNLITFHDVEPTIVVSSTVSGGSSTAQSGQPVGAFTVTADGDRQLNLTSVNVQANGNNLPWNYVTSYDLYNGSNLLSSATPLNVAAQTAGTGNALTGTSIGLCDNAASAVAGTVRLSSGNAAIAATKISVNDTIVLFESVSNYITAKVTAVQVGSATSICTTPAAADILLTVSNSSTTGTAPTGATITAVKSFNVHFDANSSTPLASQGVTAGSGLTLTVKADTTAVRTGAVSGSTVSFNTKINGTQGASNGGLTWGYTPSGGSALTGFTISDSYPVNGPTFLY
ncbi:MAG: hypothetical protein WC817_04320 [Patescibacteria group bacterium]|jgi:hypothetical protein